MKAKKVIIIAGLAVTGLALMSYKKLEAAKEVMNNVNVAVKKISNVKISLKSLSFNAILLLENTTNIDFGATLSSKIVVKQIRVFNEKNIFLGKADTNFFSLDLPAFGVAELPEVKFNLSLQNVLSDFLNNTNNYLTNDFTKYNYKIDVEVFGKTLTLSA